MITKFDKLCKNSPEYYSLIERNKYGNRYKIADKTLVSYRQKKKEMSPYLDVIARTYACVLVLAVLLQTKI